MCKLFDLCIERGAYPESLKIAKLIPIYKTANVGSVANYRPISLLQLLNKIFEKLLYIRLNHFLENCNIISQNKFSFRKAKDTQRATLKLLDSRLPAMSSKKCFGCVFVDFSKAFDTVDHPILLYKMERYGVRGKSILIITSYLRNRKHHVCIDGIYSESLECTVGVPQGSCLGPLLFFIYTNDLNYLLENKVNPVLFADDTSIAYCCEDPAVLGFKLNCWL